MVTYTYLDSAAETTLPPFGSDIEKSSISVPPPQNETLRGVRLIIIETSGQSVTHQDAGLEELGISCNDKAYERAASARVREQWAT